MLSTLYVGLTFRLLHLFDGYFRMIQGLKITAEVVFLCCFFSFNGYYTLHVIVSEARRSVGGVKEI